jgi:L-alanine-DL-glutamate epimerase-like enolase superfamily enzyme
MTRWQVREWLEKHVSQYLMTDPLWNGGIGETRKIAAMAEAFGIPMILHNVAGPFAQAACLHLGAHIPNLAFIESCRAFHQTYFPILADYAPIVVDGQFSLLDGPGLGLKLREEALARPDLDRQVSSGSGAAVGRRAMGDHWEREELR